MDTWVFTINTSKNTALFHFVPADSELEALFLFELSGDFGLNIVFVGWGSLVSVLSEIGTRTVANSGRSLLLGGR